MSRDSRHKTDEGFWQQLKRRHVVRAGITHIIVVALLVQIADVVMPYLGFVDEPVRWALVLGFGLLPVTLVVAWFFDHPWHGKGGNRHWGNVLIAALLVALGAAVITRFAPEAGQSEHRIAVIPFSHPDGDEQGRFVSRALALEVIALLAKSGSFNVTHYESASSPLLGGLNSAAVAARLGVDHILGGTVAVADGTMRLNVELLDAQGSSLWQDSLNEQIEQLGSVQEELASSVARKLGTQEDLVTLDTLAARRCARPTDPSALEQYYLGRHQVELRSAGGISLIQQAIETYRPLIEQWPEFSEAYSALAWALQMQNTWDEEGIYEDHGAEIQELARKALSQCNTLGEALVFLPNEVDHNNHWINQEQQFRMALEMQPGSLEMAERLGESLRYAGRIAESVQVSRDNYLRNPLSITAITRYSAALQNAGQFEEAAEIEKEAKALGADLPGFAEESRKRAQCEKDLECLLQTLPPPFQPVKETFRKIYTTPANESEKAQALDTAMALLQENPWMVNWLNANACGFDHLTDLFFLVWDFSQENNEFWFWPNTWRPQCHNVWTDPRFPAWAQEQGFEEYWNEKGWMDYCNPGQDGAGYECIDPES